MRAWIRTDRLTGLNLTTGDIINAIQSQNVQAAGRPHRRAADLQRPAIAAQHPDQGPAAPRSRSSHNIVIRTNPDGSVLRLGDVARLELGAANLDRETRFNGGPAAVIAHLPVARRQRDRDARKRSRERWPTLEKRFPEDLAWKVTYDPTVFVTDTIHEVQKTLIEAFILVVLVVYLFLGSLRATLIPTFAVPVSLIGTFIVLNAIGYSANTVSLLAVVLAIGIVVDDAIVVVENVERVMEEHPGADARPRRPSRRWREITAPIIAITLVLLSVFVPVAFIPGISGELFRQFAVTVAVSMLLSAINALTLSPALVRRAAEAASRAAPRADRRASCAAIDRVATPTARRRAPRALLGHRPRHGGRRRRRRRRAAKVTPTGFLPEDDQGAFFVVVQLPDGASVGRTTDVVGSAEAILKRGAAVADYTSVIGLNFIDNYSQPNSAFIVVTLKPFEERKDRSQSAPARSSHGSAPKFRQIRGRHRRAARAAADHRPRHGRRLRLRPAGPARRRSARRWRRSCADSSWRRTRIRS